MITKAIIDSIISPFQIKVRIPILHGIEGISAATSANDLPTATINCLPGISPFLQKGDIIFVGFDSNDESRPIMLGYLSKSTMENCAGQINSSSLTVNDYAILPQATSIGTITPENILALDRVEGNIEDRLSTIEATLKSLMDKIYNNEEGKE